MRSQRILHLASALLLVGCAEEADDPVGPLFGVSDTRSVASRTVGVTVVDRTDPDVPARSTFDFTLEPLPDGIEVSFPRVAQEDVAFRGTAPNRYPFPASARISASGGSELLGADGSPFGRAAGRADRLRSTLQLPPRADRPRRGTDRPAPLASDRRTGLVAAEQAAKDLADLRRISDTETRLTDGRLRFEASGLGTTESWLYDATIGAVVERTVQRDGRPTLVMNYHFAPGRGGWRMDWSSVEWREGDNVLRSVVNVFPSN